MNKNLLFAAAILFLAVNTKATTHTIQVADFSFTPSSIPNVHLGDTVKWVWMSGTHTTTSTSVPTGAATWNQSMTSSSTTFIYVPTVAGNYAYDCSVHPTTMTGSFTVISTANVNTISQVLPAVSPNPSSGMLHVQFSSQLQQQSVRIINLAGQTVVSETYNAQKDADINLQNVANGVYCIQVQEGDKTSRQPFVVNH
jgi:plastocyanin